MRTTISSTGGYSLGYDGCLQYVIYCMSRQRFYISAFVMGLLMMINFVTRTYISGMIDYVDINFHIARLYWDVSLTVTFT